MAKVRLDDLLIEQGYFPNRDAVVRAVIAKEVRVDDVYAVSYTNLDVYKRQPIRCPIQP